MDTRTLAAEFLGTLLLVFFAVGAVVLAGEYIGTVGVALAFGLVLLALTYALGPVSGCHVNPAVTLGVLVAGRIGPGTAVRFWAAQLLGGLVGAALLFWLARQVPGLRTAGEFGSNGYGSRSAVQLGAQGAFVTEAMLTFLLVFVWLAVTHETAAMAFTGLAAGLGLVVVHLVGIPLTGTSVNPARSLGPALFAGGAAVRQLWLFLTAPLAGAAVAAVAYRVVRLRLLPVPPIAGV